MFLWKWFLPLAFLATVLSDEVPQVPSFPAQLTPNDVLNMLPNQKEKIKTLMERLEQQKGDERAQVAVINDYVDDLVVELNAFIMKQGIDPTPMPDIMEGFDWRIGFITYKGRMELTSGWLQGLSTIVRTGDVTVTYEYPDLKIRMPLGIDLLLFDYQYLVKFMGLGPTGGMDGKVDGCRWTLDLKLHMVHLRAEMERYKLDKLGKVNVKFNGNALVDWMVNIFVSVAIPFVTPVIKLVLQGVIAGGVQSLFDVYNQAMCTILDNCPEEQFLNMLR